MPLMEVIRHGRSREPARLRVLCMALKQDLLSRTQEDRDAAASKLREAEAQLAQERSSHERDRVQAQADARSAEAAALVQRLRELAAQKEALDRCCSYPSCCL